MDDIVRNAVNIDYVCRLCADMPPDEALVPLFEGEGLENSLPDRISKYLDFSVHLKQGLPSAVCGQCTTNLLNWHTFYKNCEKINDQFRMMLLNSNGKSKGSSSIKEKVKSPTKPTEAIDIVDLESEDVADEVDIDFDEESSTFNKIIKEVALEKSVDEQEVEEVVDDVEDEPELKPIIRRSAIQREEREETNIPAEEHMEEIEEEIVEVRKKSSRRKLPRSRSSKRMKRNTKKPLRTCPYCLDVLPVLHFPSSRQLDDHLRAEHTEKIFECEMCDRVLDRALLIDHMKEHAEELGLDDSTTDGGGGRVEDNFKENRETGRRFSCTICDRSFGYKSALKQHMKSRHSTVRGYHCKECQKAFKTSSGLYNHRRLVHLPQFNFVCDECKKQFKLQHELQRHRRTVHEKVKKYFCDQCEKGFFLQDSLTRHKRTHDKQTEFECDHCGFRTTQRRYLICHLNRKHPSGGGEEINGN